MGADLSKHVSHHLPYEFLEGFQHLIHLLILMLRDATKLLVLLGGELSDDVLLFSRRVGECRICHCGRSCKFSYGDVDIFQLMCVRSLFLSLKRGEGCFNVAEFSIVAVCADLRWGGL